MQGAAKAELVLTDPDGEEQRQTICQYKEDGGILMGMFNTNDSIRSFAKSCFNYALNEKKDLWFSAKDTISKKYDHTFKVFFRKFMIKIQGSF